MKYTILIGLLVLVLLTGCSEVTEDTLTLDQGTDEYEGTWSRQAIYSDGLLLDSEGATLVLNSGGFTSFNDICSNSGSVETREGVMVLTVTESDCPSIIGVGSVVTSYYSVNGDVLTLVNNEYGAEVIEDYLRI
jgi:hypothetical protein